MLHMISYHGRLFRVHAGRSYSFTPRQDTSIQRSHLFVELYGLVDHVFVTLLEPQVHTPTRLDEFL